MKDQRKWWACPDCGGAFPGDTPTDKNVCRCGSEAWGAPFPFPHLFAAEWGHITDLLVTRCGGICEARSPACLAASRGGQLAGVRQSRHHRQAKQSGGNVDPMVHSLANLALLCGDGTTGCHGHVHHNKAWAIERGLVIRHGSGPICDPAQVPLVLPGGLRKLLHPTSPVYLNPTDGVTYAA